MTRKQKIIVQAWDLHEESEPDISTERLFAMVSDDTGAEYDVIIAALDAAGRIGEPQ